MKSAYELAMERLQQQSPSGPPLTDEQKAQLAEMDSFYESKMAEKKILFDNEMKQAMGNPQALQEIQERLQVDIRRLEAERDEKKEAIRQQIRQSS